MAGLILDPWQRYVLEGALGEVNGKHAAFEVGVIVPRQNGKGSIIEARELAGLFLLDERLILHSAHEFKTAQEGFRRILELIQNTPDFDSQVSKVSQSHGDEGIELKSGQRLRFIARSRGSGRGFTGDCVIFDEAYNLPATAMGAMLPTLRARPNPQLWYLSSAGHLDSETLRGVRARGIAGKSRRLAYFEHSAADSEAVSDSDTIDNIDVARLMAAAVQANPAIGIRIAAESVLAEFEALDADEFNREILGIWEDPTDGGVFNAAHWRACLDSTSTIDGPVTFAVDIAEDRSWSCIAAAGRPRSNGPVDETDDVTPLVHFESADYRLGTDWLVGRCEELAERHISAAFIVQANTHAASLVTDMRNAGLYVIEASGADYAKACGRLFDAVRDGTARHIGQPEMNSAQRGARKKNAGDGSFVWDRRTENVDISPLSAGTLAFWGFLEYGSVDITDSVW